MPESEDLKSPIEERPAQPQEIEAVPVAAVPSQPDCTDPTAQQDIEGAADDHPKSEDDIFRYSPNKRNPKAERIIEEMRQDARPVPPAGYDPNRNPEPFFFPTQEQIDQASQPGQRLIPSNTQKLIWSGAGFLAGALGVAIIFFLGFRQPRNIRTEMIKWSLVGLAAGFAVDLVFMYMNGGNLPTFGTFGAGPSASTSSGSIF